MKNKNLWLITAFSLAACILHDVMLYSPFNRYLFTSIAKIVLFITLPVICIKAFKIGSFKDIFKLKGDSKYIKISLFIGLSVFAAIATAFLFLRHFLDQTMIIGAFANHGISAANFVFVFIYVVLINAALEEIFFRGFVFKKLHDMGFKRYAHIFSSLLFAVYHVAIIRGALSVGMFIFVMTMLVVAGLIFNFFTVKCRSIAGALIVHVSANFALNLIMTYYLYM
jgi:membrane protease YdiL (CAAX protease family)